MRDHGRDRAVEEVQDPVMNASRRRSINRQVVYI
jgi:hypothetical protein